VVKNFIQNNFFEFALLQNFHITSGAHTASYSICIGFSFSEKKALVVWCRPIASI